MDLSKLNLRYPSGIPTRLTDAAGKIWSQLSKQEDHVLSAKAMENFDIDHDMSTQCGHTIYKGLIVDLKPTYVVSAQDTWIHPNLTQCRALFNGGVFHEEADVSNFNSSAGLYTVQSTNEIGDSQIDHFTIVDTHLQDIAQNVRDEWNGKKLSEVYSSTLKEQTLQHAKDIAGRFGVDDLVRADFTNMLYRGSNTMHFYNNAYKDAGLVLVSPLMGYSVVNSKDHAADYMSETDMVHVASLTPAQQKSFYSKCRWGDSGEIVNTHVVKKAFKGSAGYRMQKANFGTQPIHHLLTPRQLLHLTPSTEHIPESFLVNEFSKYDKIRVPFTKEVADKLFELRDTFEIMNGEHYSAGELTLPRYIVEALC